MLCGGARAVVSHGRPHIVRYPCRRSSPPLTTAVRFCASQSRRSIRMSAGNPPPTTQIIEHIVLFKVKPDVDPSKPIAMVNNLAGLASLDSVLHISAGPVLRCRSSSLTFTHMLHSRYASKADLDDYSAHPAHVAVVNDYVKPIVEDVMAVDWVSSTSPVSVPPGSALRLTFLKLKEELGEKAKDEVLEVLGGIKDKFPSIEHLSLGENISPARAKGFSIASIAIFKGTNELEGLDSESEAANEQKDLVRDKLNGVVVLDYVVPSPTANL